MAAPPTNREQVELPPVGNTSSPPFLDRWGVIFLGYAGSWILVIGIAVLVYYFLNQPPFPHTQGMSNEQAREALSLHKELHGQWVDSLTQIFDLLVTKTVLPIVTLLLGYLFGRRKD